MNLNKRDDIPMIQVASPTQILALSERLAFLENNDVLITRTVESIRAFVCTFLPQYADLEWARLAFGIDGLTTDHNRLLKALSPTETVYRLATRESKNLLTDPISVESFYLSCIRLRLRTDANLRRQLQLRLSEVLPSRTPEEDGLIGSLITIQLGRVDTLKQYTASSRPLVDSHGMIAPGIFSLEIFTPSEADALIAELGAERVWLEGQTVSHREFVAPAEREAIGRRTASVLPEPSKNKILTEVKRRVLATVEKKIFSVFGIKIKEFIDSELVRYDIGGGITPHVDDGFHSRRRLFSVVCYLNDSFSGGRTYFPIQNMDFCLPRGQALFFPAQFSHSSTEIKAGKKYVALGFLTGDTRNEGPVPGGGGVGCGHNG